MRMIPYVTTLAWTGRIGDGDITGLEYGSEDSQNIEAGQYSGDKTVIVVRDEMETAISVEEFLIHVLAAQIPADFEMETLKAQAVLARTYIYRLMDGKSQIFEEELDMDALSRTQMEKKWGSSEFAKMYGNLKAAVDATKGQTILYEGTYIEPLYCYASAGVTRSRGDAYPFLKQTESPKDLLEDGYLSMPMFSADELAARINEISGAVAVAASQLPGEIQIVERDGAGYVKQVQIGQKTYTGEEVQYALGLSSACYSFEEFDGKIRVICKGVGHGYGFAQFGANEMAKEGMGYQELLKYYFQNVEIMGDEK